MRNLSSNQRQSEPSPIYERLGNPSPVLEIRERPDAPMLLFYPGSLLEPGHYQRLLSALYARGFAVCGIHLAGHGLGYAQKKFTFQKLLAEGLAAEAWLEKRYARPIIVSGHSQGAILALAHAANSEAAKAVFAISGAYPQIPEAIRLTLFGPFEPHREKIAGFVANMARRFPSLPILLPMYLSLLKICAGKRDPLEMGKGKLRLSYPLGYLDSLFQANVPEPAKCPVWLISAQNDALFTREIIEKTFARIKASRKQLVWLADGGHTAPFNPELAWQISGIILAGCGDLGLMELKTQ